LHAHLGIHHPLRIDLYDRWAGRALAAGAYHVWHPEGRAFEEAPLTRFEASARRSQRFEQVGPMPYEQIPDASRRAPDAPYTLDLRRIRLDRPMPPPEEREPFEAQSIAQVGW
ncbi:MAG: transglutaminase family protein, partial [Myxococcota bacterium]